MLPVFKPGDRIVVDVKVRPKEGDVVALRKPGISRLILKRVFKISYSRYFVQGDNGPQSTDSRDFGPVLRREIIGKVVLRY